MSEYDSLIDGFDADEKEVVSHGMTVGDQSTADALDEILGVEKIQDVVEMTKEAWVEAEARDEPPHEPDDWPEPEPEIPLYGDIPVVVDPELPEGTVMLTELRALKPDQRPERGKHYVIFDGKPMPVVRDNLTATEDEFVRSQISPVDDLKDPDGNRKVRADRALRLRYRGYVCGQMSSL